MIQPLNLDRKNKAHVSERILHTNSAGPGSYPSWVARTTSTDSLCPLNDPESIPASANFPLYPNLFIHFPNFVAHCLSEAPKTVRHNFRMKHEEKLLRLPKKLHLAKKIKKAVMDRKSGGGGDLNVQLCQDTIDLYQISKDDDSASIAFEELLSQGVPDGTNGACGVTFYHALCYFTRRMRTPGFRASPRVFSMVKRAIDETKCIIERGAQVSIGKMEVNLMDAVYENHVLGEILEEGARTWSVNEQTLRLLCYIGGFETETLSLVS